MQLQANWLNWLRTRVGMLHYSIYPLPDQPATYTWTMRGWSLWTIVYLRLRATHKCNRRFNAKFVMTAIRGARYEGNTPVLTVLYSTSGIANFLWNTKPMECASSMSTNPLERSTVHCHGSFLFAGSSVATIQRAFVYEEPTLMDFYVHCHFKCIRAVSSFIKFDNFFFFFHLFIG